MTAHICSSCKGTQKTYNAACDSWVRCKACGGAGKVVGLQLVEFSPAIIKAIMDPTIPELPSVEY